LTELETLPGHTTVAAAAEMLRRTGDAQEALKLARQELLKARRARSRKLFAFWTEVATEIENLRADPS
jgi:malate synthase